MNKFMAKGRMNLNIKGVYSLLEPDSLIIDSAKKYAAINKLNRETDSRG